MRDVACDLNFVVGHRASARSCRDIELGRLRGLEAQWSSPPRAADAIAASGA